MFSYEPLTFLYSTIMAVITAEKLTKIYRNYKRSGSVGKSLRNFFIRDYEEISAVDDISFEIDSGELVGYIGPNGAGKSTTIKMLTGILIPTSGRLHVHGFVPSRQRYEYTQHIGVVFGQRTQLWWDIPVIDSYRLLRKVYQIPKSEFDSRLNDFKALLDLDPILNVPVRKLSLGQRMRCDVVASMLHNPKIIFLDEPTIGLDIIAKLNIRDFLEKINRETGVTMILTTHDLQEIEELCKRLIIIDHGKILYDGDISGLRRRCKFDRFIIFQLTESIALETITNDLGLSSSVQWEQIDPLRIKATFNIELFNPTTIIEAVLRRLPVHDISIEEPSIESIVGHIYAKGKA